MMVTASRVADGRTDGSHAIQTSVRCRAKTHAPERDRLLLGRHVLLARSRAGSPDARGSPAQPPTARRHALESSMRARIFHDAVPSGHRRGRDSRWLGALDLAASTSRAADGRTDGHFPPRAPRFLRGEHRTLGKARIELARARTKATGRVAPPWQSL